MEPFDLDKLKKIKTPAPRESAKKRTLEAAALAFEKENQKKLTFFQGIEKRLRLMSSYIKQLFIMKNTTKYATAGIGLIICIGIGTQLDIFKSFNDENRQFTLDPISEGGEKQKGATRGDSIKTREYSIKPLTSSVVLEELESNDLEDAFSFAPEQSKNAAFSLRRERQLEVSSPIINNIKQPSFENQPLKLVSEKPVSTFSIDVDTANYALIRNQINSGNLPPQDSVRIEELVNYFDYDYALPKSKNQPFRPNVTIYPSPWHEGKKIIHLGIKGYDLDENLRKKANLVFLLDVSGSMNARDKLPLLKKSFNLLLNTLQPSDSVAIVTYAGRSATILEPTLVKEKDTILDALNNLQSGGSTAGEQGIHQAYALAQKNFDTDGVNRVMLATDGDFNVGISHPDELKDFIAEKRKTGIFLSVLGFGMHQSSDSTMQALAQNGNGIAAYIDSLSEAQKVLVEESNANLFTIAKDVKIQVEFNPTKVSEYRLIGYQTRILNREDFNNDKIDAGEIGCGHSVTAIYEITPKGSSAQLVDDLRYSESETKTTTNQANSDEYAFLKIRYKEPNEDKSKLLTLAINSELEVTDIYAAPEDVRFANAVTAFGQILRNNDFTSTYSYDELIDLANSGKGRDEFGYRAEFIKLVRLAKSLK